MELLQLLQRQQRQQLPLQGQHRTTATPHRTMVLALLRRAPPPQ